MHDGCIATVRTAHLRPPTAATPAWGVSSGPWRAPWAAAARRRTPASMQVRRGLMTGAENRLGARPAKGGAQGGMVLVQRCGGPPPRGHTRQIASRSLRARCQQLLQLLWLGRHSVETTVTAQTHSHPISAAACLGFGLPARLHRSDRQSARSEFRVYLNGRAVGWPGGYRERALRVASSAWLGPGVAECQAVFQGL